MADNDLTIKITAETKAAITAVGKLNDELDDLVKQEKKSSTQVKKTVAQNKKTANSYKSIGIGLKSVVASLAAMGVAAKAIEFEKLAEDAEQSAEAFKLVFEDMGLVAEDEFNKIKEASRDLIPEAAIRQSAVTAASLGVPIEKLAELMEIARVKSREMGTDAQSAFNDLAVGIGRGSPMILDNLGLTIKLEDANKKYAAELGKTVEAMTKQEKQMALTNAVIEAGADSIDRFKDATLSSAQQSQVLNSKLADMKVQLGQNLIPLMNTLKTNTINWLSSIDEAAIKKVTDSLGAVGKALKTVNDYLVPDLGQEGRGAFDTIADGYSKIAQHAGLWSTYADSLDLTEGVRESKTDIDEFIKSLANFGNEGDTYEGKLDNLKKAYNEQAEEVKNLLKENQKLSKWFGETDSVAFKHELAILIEEEKKLEEQSAKLGNTYSAIFDSDTATKAKESADAIANLKEQLGQLSDAGEDNYEINPNISIDEKQSIIEISDALGNVENKTEIKPTVKIDEKETAKELDASVIAAINALGKPNILVQFDEKAAQDALRTTLGAINPDNNLGVTAGLEYEEDITLKDFLSNKQQEADARTIDVRVRFIPVNTVQSITPAGTTITGTDPTQTTIDALNDDLLIGE